MAGMKTIVGLLIGYAQVMGQISLIYNEDLISPLLARFLAVFNYFNPNLNLLNLHCFAHHVAPFLTTSSFWASFWQAVATPPLLCVFFALLYYYLARIRARRQCITEDSSGSDQSK
eukprot:gene5571-6757_t